MAISEIYRKHVAPLVQALPHIAEEPDFALKGDTAINLFVRDVPRLSVDIDLTIPADQRSRDFARRDRRGHSTLGYTPPRVPRARVTMGRLRPKGVATKLVLRVGAAQI